MTTKRTPTKDPREFAAYVRPPEPTMSRELSRTQRELFDAMKSGVVVHFMGGLNAYYFRSDTMRSCTAPAQALLDKGYAVRVGKFSRVTLELTP